MNNPFSLTIPFCSRPVHILALLYFCSHHSILFKDYLNFTWFSSTISFSLTSPALNPDCIKTQDYQQWSWVFLFLQIFIWNSLILTMLWNPSYKLLKCFWLLDSNLVLSLIQPTSPILSVFQTSRCLPAYQSLNGQPQLSLPIPFKYYIFKIKTTPDNLNPAAGTTARCSGFSKTKMVMCFI